MPLHINLCLVSSLPVVRASEIGVGIGAGQIEEVQDLVQRCRGPAVIILNAGWTPDQLNPQQRNALQAFQQVYAFVPLGFKVRSFLPCCEQHRLQSRWSLVGAMPNARNWRCKFHAAGG